MVEEVCLPNGAEWVPQVRGWCLVQISRGAGYWRLTDATLELVPGSVLLLSSNTRGLLRASQLNEVVLHYFCVEPDQLTGLVSLGEQHFFERLALQGSEKPRTLAPAEPVAEKLRDLVRKRSEHDLSHRFQLLQLFTELFQQDLRRKQTVAEGEYSVRDRLRGMIRQMPSSEFRNVSIGDLARQLNCSPRHLSRLFRQEFDASFREKQTEIRLARAKQLLAATNTKVLDVALESGYQSHSLFNLVFKRRFGMSPGKWREQYRKKRLQRNATTASVMTVLFGWFQLLLGC